MYRRCGSCGAKGEAVKRTAFLKNYTSNVPMSQTIYRIEQVLIKCGVSGVMKEYGPAGDVLAISFKIDLENGKPWMIRLPANTKKATDALWLHYANGDSLTSDGQKLSYDCGKKKKTRADFVEQGQRTAWKIVQDWVEVQMSMIQMQQADFREVFLPYVWDGKRSYFQALQESGFKALLPEKTEA
jgi:hypothetical protein